MKLNQMAMLEQGQLQTQKTIVSAEKNISSAEHEIKRSANDIRLVGAGMQETRTAFEETRVHIQRDNAQTRRDMQADNKLFQDGLEKQTNARLSKVESRVGRFASRFDLSILEEKLKKNVGRIVKILTISICILLGFELFPNESFGSTLAASAGLGVVISEFVVPFAELLYKEFIKCSRWFFSKCKIMDKNYASNVLDNTLENDLENEPLLLPTSTHLMNPHFSSTSDKTLSALPQNSQDHKSGESGSPLPPSQPSDSLTDSVTNIEIATATNKSIQFSRNATLMSQTSGRAPEYLVPIHESKSLSDIPGSIQAASLGNVKSSTSSDESPIMRSKSSDAQGMPVDAQGSEVKQRIDDRKAAHDNVLASEPLTLQSTLSLALAQTPVQRPQTAAVTNLILPLSPLLLSDDARKIAEASAAAQTSGQTLTLTSSPSADSLAPKRPATASPQPSSGAGTKNGGAIRGGKAETAGTKAAKGRKPKSFKG